jgi:hypothetical protein
MVANDVIGASVVEPYLFFTVPFPSFEKLWFWFQFQLLKSYGSGSGSYFRKVPVPILVPAPYLDHKTQIFQKITLDSFLPFYLVSCFVREKFINFNKFIVKCK